MTHTSLLFLSASSGDFVSGRQAPHPDFRNTDISHERRLSMRRRSLLAIALAFALFTLGGFGLRAFAQATFAKVVGDVRDTSGASVAGAKVTITNNQTGETFTQTTSELGNYNFQTLNPGAYRIRCE